MLCLWSIPDHWLCGQLLISSANNQPISLTKQQSSILSDQVCICFLCPWKQIIHAFAVLEKQRWGLACSATAASIDWRCVCRGDGSLRQHSYSCLTQVHPHSDPSAAHHSWGGIPCQITDSLQWSERSSMCLGRKRSQVFLWSVSLIVSTFWHENKAFTYRPG